MADFRNRKEFEKWLSDKPRDWAVVLAVRSALRVLPMLANARQVEDFGSVIVLPVVRALVLSWSANGSRASELAYADYANAAAAATAVAAATSAVTAYAANAAANAAYAAAYTSNSEAYDAIRTAANAAEYVAQAAAYTPATSAAIWDALERDGTRLGNGTNATELAHTPLWADTKNRFFYGQREALRHALSQLSGDWYVWQSWYDSRFEGQSSFGLSPSAAEAIDLRIARQDDDWWKRGPDAVNAAIAGWVVEAQGGAGGIPEQVQAAVVPTWNGGVLTNSAALIAAETTPNNIDAALAALRSALTSLADAVEAQDNLDKPFAAYLRELADATPTATARKDRIFDFAHNEEVFAEYSRTVGVEWPNLLAARYEALRLQFNRTTDKFEDWRAFKAKPKAEMSGAEIEGAKLAVETVGEQLSAENGAEFVAPDVSTAVRELGENIDPKSTGLATQSRAEDALESTNNVLKRLAEAALTVAGEGMRFAIENIGTGAGKEAEKQFQGLGQNFVKWTSRLFYASAAGGLAWLGGMPLWQWLVTSFPDKFAWLEPVARTLANVLGL